MQVHELAHLNAWAPLQHDPDDCVPTGIVDGIAGAVGRPIAQAPWSISVGVGELHQYAGISGGHQGSQWAVAGLRRSLRCTTEIESWRQGFRSVASRATPFERPSMASGAPRGVALR
jgi:hypothetical protein